MKYFVSYNKTNVKLNNKKQVLKKYTINTLPKKYHKFINKQINIYHKSLYKGCNAIPKMISNKKDLEFCFQYCGESLYEIIQNKSLTIKKMHLIFDGVINILNQCEKNKLDIDPHFKNFTMKKDKVYFVDIFPPLTKNYIRLLTNYNLNIKSDITNHISTWKFNIIKHHFLADLKKSKFINRKFYILAKKYFLSQNVLKKIDYSLINKIIRIEEKNLKSKKFTLS